MRTSSEVTITFNDDWDQAKIIDFQNRTDAADWISINGIKLYLGVSISDEERVSYSLPPKPIVSRMDVRFRGDVIYCGKNGFVEVQADKIFLNLEYHFSNPENIWNWTDLSDGSVTVLESNGTTIINNSELFKIEEQPVLPNRITLFPNYPNPFNPKTLIRIDLSKETIISLDIFDISGQHITNLKKGLSDAGIYEIEWDGKNTNGISFPAGIYFYTLSFENRKISHKMVLLK